MRILVFHGYLLGGTGSNVYNARLAAALVALGNEVHLLCQERHPEAHAFVDAAGDWEGGRLSVRAMREPVRCTVYRPDIGSLLPVYVADRYEGVEARTFAACSDSELLAYVQANVEAVREVAARVKPQLALANHLVMGPAILARALAGEVPYAVKVHGSALEYTVKPQPERFLPFAREGLDRARAVLVGSRHTAESLWQTMADPGLPARTRLGPPGVDVERFSPREPARAALGLRELAQRLRAAGTRAHPGEDAFARDERAAGEQLARVEVERDRLVAFVGKLIVSKGVELPIAAWPLVIAQHPRARLLVVGFGAYRRALEELLRALGAGELARAKEIAVAGRALEDGSQPAAPLAQLLSFLHGLEGDERERYVRAAASLQEAVIFTGRLDHDELAEVLPACEAMVVPSTFPEAFGMVAAEAAACGALPVSAAHSGLAEVSAVLAAALPEQAAWMLSFAPDEGAVRALAARVIAWLDAGAQLRQRAREALVATVREHWSWEQCAARYADLLRSRCPPSWPLARAPVAGPAARSTLRAARPPARGPSPAGARARRCRLLAEGRRQRQRNHRQAAVRGQVRVLSHPRARGHQGDRGPQPRRSLPPGALRRGGPKHRARHR